MPGAKDLVVAKIDAKTANNFVRRTHYSGKVDTRSQVHLGVFLNDRLEGVMQFGPSIDKNKSVGLVKDTPWNGFLELNRLAFSEKLPKNSESRAISIAMKLFKKHAPHIKWILSYADGTQCGDGTIYRASGFSLIQIKKNNSMWRMPDGEVLCKIVLEPGFSPSQGGNTAKSRYGKTGTGTSTSFLKEIGAECLPGFQLKYIYFLDKSYADKLTVPILPFSEIEKHNASMYRGASRVGVIDSSPAFLAGGDGASPITRLQN
jgi:hypothetical protein